MSNKHTKKNKAISSKRSTNTNKTITRSREHNGYPVLSEDGPLIVEYLERTYKTILNAVEEHPRTLAIRIDLNLPSGEYDSAVISRFFGSLKAKIRHDTTVRRKNAHPTSVRHIWVKEYASQSHPHYHVVLLLNLDTYSSVGYFSLDSDNLYRRINEAWASALNLSVNETVGLVNFPKNYRYEVNRGDDVSIGQLFERTSYLCKLATKPYSNHQRHFGCSRNVAIKQPLIWPPDL